VTFSMQHVREQADRSLGKTRATKYRKGQQHHDLGEVSSWVCGVLLGKVAWLWKEQLDSHEVRWTTTVQGIQLVVARAAPKITTSRHNSSFPAESWRPGRLQFFDGL
jgi:hypothetical protein